MNYDFDVVIVGAGVVGLAIAYEISKREDISVLLVDREASFGMHTSSRNSEVIHAGIYYPLQSAKGAFCLEGRKLLYDFCDAYGVPYQKLGKYIIATNDAEEEKLQTLYSKAKDLGYEEIRWAEKPELEREEPSLRAQRGLFSPETGILDSHAYMTTLLGLAENNGSVFVANTVVDQIDMLTSGFLLRGASGDKDEFEITAAKVINSAGLYAWEVARELYQKAHKTLPKKVLAKGNYFSFSRKSPFKHLIYPVPVDGGLGVHLTLDMMGNARFGPDVEWIDEIDYSFNDERKEQFYQAIKAYYPEIRAEDLQPDYTGIRPKVQPAGTESDFLIDVVVQSEESRAINLFGIESPGLTSSLAIAKYVASLV